MADEEINGVPIDFETNDEKNLRSRERSEVRSDPPGQ